MGGDDFFAFDASAEKKKESDKVDDEHLVETKFKD